MSERPWPCCGSVAARAGTPLPLRHRVAPPRVRGAVPPVSGADARTAPRRSARAHTDHDLGWGILGITAWAQGVAHKVLPAESELQADARPVAHDPHDRLWPSSICGSTVLPDSGACADLPLQSSWHRQGLPIVSDTATHPNRSEAERFWNFPRVAIDEAIVNAVYHRSYEEREPVEVRISPEDFVVLSFPGPDRSLRMADLRAGRAVSRRYRNRRIGEFLKELDLTEGRSTGVPKILRAMENNGSPPPEFESDEERTYFLIRLPVHERAERGTPHVTPHVTPQVTPQVEKTILAVQGEMLRAELMDAVGLKDRMHFVNEYLQPALGLDLVEMTIPDKPRSSKQRYRLTEVGRRLQAELASRGPDNAEGDPA
ncbi:MAG: hypothetical protein HY812_16120 [Planctomycetes bacterium]|nr:hypothetical protein [Planctomycetota bacterium]